MGITFQTPQTSGLLCTGARLNPSGEIRKAGEVRGLATEDNKGLAIGGETATSGSTAMRSFSQSTLCSPNSHSKRAFHNRQDVVGEWQEGIAN